MQQNQINLDGRKAAITGGASGLGYATARRLLRCGANVVLRDLKMSELERAALEMAPEGPLRIVAVNVADHTSGRAAIPMGRLGRPDEIAAMIAWLASEECSFSTGAAFDLSGGRSSH